MRLVWLVVPAVLLLLAPAVLSATPPTIVTRYDTPEIQRLLDAALQNEHVKSAFKDGKTVTIRESGGRAGHDVWSGTAMGGAVALSPGAIEGANVEVTIDSAALYSLVNAYDPTNSALLALQRHFITVKTDDAAEQLAVNGVQKTPAAGEVGRELRTGDTIDHKGCSGRLSGNMEVDLCGRTYIVSTLGGIVGRFPPRGFDVRSADADTSGLSGLSTGARTEVAENCKGSYAYVIGIDVSREINHCIAATLGVS